MFLRAASARSPAGEAMVAAAEVVVVVVVVVVMVQVREDWCSVAPALLIVLLVDPVGGSFSLDRFRADI